MIKRLQKKFVLIAMCSFLLVTITVIGSINAVNFGRMSDRADWLLSILAKGDGSFSEFNIPPPRPLPDFANPAFRLTPETRFETRYFSLKLNYTGETMEVDTQNIAAVSVDEAEEYGRTVLHSGKRTGFSGVYKFLVQDTDYGRLLLFVDCRQQFQMAFTFLLVSGGIALFSLSIVFLLVSAFSKRAIRPIIESMEKQKRFITDAGHEIKTPLAIISANTDVLELEVGKSEWTESIRHQTQRLTGLVGSLLTLSQLQEQDIKHCFASFDLSSLVGDVTLQFDTLAGAQAKQLSTGIKDNISLVGDPASIRRLVTILIENAVKYADEQSTVNVALSQNGKNIRLDVGNSCAGVSGLDLPHLFDRFYRSDSARSRDTGGYGIGLSVAKAIVEAHGGRIDARNEDNTEIWFTVLF